LPVKHLPPGASSASIILLFDHTTPIIPTEAAHNFFQAETAAAWHQEALTPPDHHPDQINTLNNQQDQGPDETG